MARIDHMDHSGARSTQTQQKFEEHFIGMCLQLYNVGTLYYKHWRMKTYLLPFLLLICLSPKVNAFDFRPGMIIPGVHVGYIFGAGISFGSELSYSPFVFDIGSGKTATGLYANATWFYSKGELYTQMWYRSLSAGALMFSDNSFMFRADANKTLLRWGVNGRNKTRSKQVTPELDLSYPPTRNGEYIGYRIFFPGNACFGLDIGVANEAYATYRYNFDRVAFEDPAFPVFFQDANQ